VNKTVVLLCMIGVLVWNKPLPVKTASDWWKMFHTKYAKVIPGYVDYYTTE
jgi:hypothetical protein